MRERLVTLCSSFPDGLFIFACYDGGRKGAVGMSKRRRVAAALGIVLGVYVLLAALPYAFPPAAERAQAAFVPVEDGAAGDRATILTTGEEALSLIHI